MAVFPGPELASAEAVARKAGAWVAGGLEYAPAGSLGPGWWGVFEAPQSVTKDELQAVADPSAVRTGPLTGVWSFAEYETAFTEVKRALAQGVSYQVNLTFPLAGRAVSGSPWTWRSALRLWLDLVGGQGKEGVFAVLGTEETPGPVVVSASPELFFEREGSAVTARPMKGTAPRDPDPARDAALGNSLASDPKCRAENLMVTDMLRNDLGRLAVPGGVSVPRLFEPEAYPTVWQMTSTVRATLAGDPVLTDVMEALFPCASITGAPKISTQAVIDRVEARPRGWYTGTLGWHRPGSPVEGPPRSRFSVLIRTLVFDQPTVPEFHLGVGGGVVWDSTAKGEWDEAWAKTRFLTPTQREFSLTEAILWEPESGYFLLPEHTARLGAACEDFGGSLDASALVRALDAEVARCGEAFGAQPLKLRVLVDPEFRLTVEGAPVPPQADPLSVALAPRPLGPETLLWRRYKTSDRRVYEELRVPEVDQTLYYNQDGLLTESTTMNLVVERAGRFFTPALGAGLLDGTFRRHLVAQGRIEETELPVQGLSGADRLWLVNSVRGWKRARLSD
ncbi:MAG TPA: chorismate-binding protein [Spirochaetia bacterium]|nr:chorismate-binding protein [Spirochaetia bacterium]